MDYKEELRKHYMVEFFPPSYLEEKLLQLIPKQREVIGELFIELKLLSYTVADDRSKFWAIFVADDTEDLENTIHRLPMTAFMEYDYKELMFYNSLHLIPSMSLN